MYAETGLMYPYVQNFTQEVQIEEFCCSQRPNAPLGIASSISIPDNNLWGGDLFQAPELVIEEPVMGIDPMTAAISMISCREDVISPQSLDSIESGQLFSDVFYECRKDILAKEGNGTIPLSEVLSSKIPTPKTDENLIAEDPFQKSINPGCLNTTEGVHEAPLKPSFLDFPVMDFGSVYGMRRAFSEGDIKTLGNGNISLIQSQMELPKTMGSIFSSEDRREKLSRYRSKKSRRNFDRKIKYACRKALADSQPRIRGRFAKTDETESYKKQ